MTDAKKQTEISPHGRMQRPRRPLITGFPVLVDACVLVNSTIRDFILWSADLALFRPVWSEQILGEVRRTLVGKLGVQPIRADYMIGQMREAFPEAIVEGYEPLIPAMTNHEGDRHVLAAAVMGRAQLVVTANQKHFPADALRQYNVEVVDADDFLRDLLDVDPERMVEVLTTIAESRKMPPKSVDELLAALEQNVCPGFSVDLRNELQRRFSDS